MMFNFMLYLLFMSLLIIKSQQDIGPRNPTNDPSINPTVTYEPSIKPSTLPTVVSTYFPSTFEPTGSPSSDPTVSPSADPSLEPSIDPSAVPSTSPTIEPTFGPTTDPSLSPSVDPTISPSCMPSVIPSSLGPTENPSITPSSDPTVSPSADPSLEPSIDPSAVPSTSPTIEPTFGPTTDPSLSPSVNPTISPSCIPSVIPSVGPTEDPSLNPTQIPSLMPSSQPSAQPSSSPSGIPSLIPSMQPSSYPSTQPSSQPSSAPSTVPTRRGDLRSYNCEDANKCEGGDPEECLYVTPQVVLQCVDKFTPCVIVTNSLTVGPYTNLTINGSCEFVVIAKSDIKILSDSVINGASMNFTTQKSISMRSKSNIYYSNIFTSYSVLNTSLLGNVIPRPYSDNNEMKSNDSSVNIVSKSKGVSLYNISASTVYISGYDVELVHEGLIKAPSYLHNNSLCLEGIIVQHLHCDRLNQVAHTVMIQSRNMMILQSGSNIISAFILLCSETLHVEQNAVISSDYLGCRENQGSGKGLYGGSNGGGGGGYAGKGGSGSNNANNGGEVYYNSDLVSSGSGGGCSTNGITGSRGGGIVSIVCTKNFKLSGSISALGEIGEATCGGGAGGSISVNTIATAGKGGMYATGGEGGSSNNFGGGGGGGVIQIFMEDETSDADYYNINFLFEGKLKVDGGTAGSISSSSGRYSLKLEDSSDNSDGGSGEVSLPSCAAGYGNDASKGIVCQKCSKGTYSTGGIDATCKPCDNAPNHSSYTEEGEESSNCSYECEDGYTTTKCYTPLEYFVYNTIGVTGLIIFLVSITFLVFAPLIYYRYKRKYDWSSLREEIFVFIFQTIRKTDPEDGNTTITKNPISNPEDCENSSSGIRVMKFKLYLKEQRKEYQLVDSDLPFHACRVNLLGSNHPFQTAGGSWILPTARPPCLRPMLRKIQYQEFAEAINKAMAWSLLSSDVFIFYLITLLIPPLSAVYMRRLRKRKANELIDMIIKYDYSCFRCPQQRLAKNSLRIGISPDATLAYIDFLFDEVEFNRRAKPLCPIGQVKLPVAFKFAGLGTYFSPYYVDTNDLILQAVPQTDIPSSFINESWISFIVELNTLLRSLQSDALHVSVQKIIQFLAYKNSTTSLGGLVIEFCTFANIEIKFDSENIIDSKSSEERGSFVHADTVLNDSDEFFTRKDSFDSGNVFNRILGIFVHPTNNKPVERRPSVVEQETQPTSAESSYRFSASAARESLRKYFTNVFDYLSQLLMKIISILKNLFEFNFDSSDPYGRTLSFHRMCKAVQLGKLRMGIIVTHPKVENDNYMVADEDYASADEEYYTEFDETENLNKTISSPISRVNNISKEKEISDEFDLQANDNEYDWNAVLKMKYGKKALELKKFHNMVQIADETAVSKSPISDAEILSPSLSTNQDLINPHIKSTLLSEAVDLNNSSTNNNSKMNNNSNESSFVDSYKEFNSRKSFDHVNDDETVISNNHTRTLSDTFEIDKIRISDITSDYTNFFRSKHDSDNIGEMLRNSIGDLLPEDTDQTTITTIKSSSKINYSVSKHTSFGEEYAEFDSESVFHKNRIESGSFDIKSNELHFHDIYEINSHIDSLILKKSIDGNASNKIRSVDIRNILHSSIKSETNSKMNLNSLSAIKKLRILKKERRRILEVNLAPSAYQQGVNCWYIILDDAFPFPISRGKHINDDEMNQNRLTNDSASTISAEHSIVTSPVLIELKKFLTKPTSEEVFQNTLHQQHADAMSNINKDIEADTTNAYKSNFVMYRKFSFLRAIKSAYKNRLLMSYFSRFLFGFNVYPYGPKGTRNFLEIMILILVLLDFALVAWIFVYYFCASSDTTTCRNHNSLIMISIFWPLAPVLAPLMGLIALFLGPSKKLARVYSLWVRLSGVNTIIMIAFFFQFLGYFQSTLLSPWPLIVYSCSRAIQLILGDLYVAHIEMIRYTRGWDGLHTSLYKTKDRNNYDSY